MAHYRGGYRRDRPSSYDSDDGHRPFRDAHRLSKDAKYRRNYSPERRSPPRERYGDRFSVRSDRNRAYRSRGDSPEHKRRSPFGNESPRYRSRDDGAGGRPMLRESRLDIQAKETRNMLLANDLFRDLLLATGDQTSFAHRDKIKNDLRSASRGRSASRERRNSRSRRRRSSSQEGWRHKHYESRHKRQSRSTSSSDTRSSSRSRNRGRHRRSRSTTSSGSGFVRKSKNLNNDSMSKREKGGNQMNEPTPQQTELFKEEMYRRLRAELTSGKGPKHLEEQIACHIQEMAKLSPALFKAFMAENAEDLSAMISALSNQPEQHVKDSCSEQTGALHQETQETLIEREKIEMPSTSKVHPLDVFEELGAAPVGTDLTKPSVLSSIDKEKLYEQWRALIFPNKPGSSDQAGPKPVDNSSFNPRPRTTVSPYLSKDENTAGFIRRESDFIAQEINRDTFKRRAMFPVSEESSKMSHSSMSLSSRQAPSIPFKRMPLSLSLKRKPKLWKQDLERNESLEREQFKEKTEQLAILQRELDALKKLENDILRKLRLQKDSHKHPLILENIKCQQEIVDKIEAICHRKVCKTSPSQTISSQKEKLGAETTTRTSNSLPKVASSSSQKKGSKNESGPLERSQLCCVLCSVVCSSLTEFGHHLASQDHRKYGADKQPWQKEALKKYHAKDCEEIFSIQGEEFLMATSALYCTLCSELCADVEVAEAHLKSEDHFIKYNGYLLEHPLYNQQYQRRCAALISKAASSSAEKGSVTKGRIQSKDIRDGKRKSRDEGEPISPGEHKRFKDNSFSGDQENNQNNENDNENKEKDEADMELEDISDNEDKEKEEADMELEDISDDSEDFKDDDTEELGNIKQRKEKTDLRLFTRPIPKSSTQKRLLTKKPVPVSEAPGVSTNSESKEASFKNDLTEPNLRWLWKASATEENQVSSSSTPSTSVTVSSEASTPSMSAVLPAHSIEQMPVCDTSIPTPSMLTGPPPPLVLSAFPSPVVPACPAQTLLAVNAVPPLPPPVPAGAPPQPPPPPGSPPSQSAESDNAAGQSDSTVVPSEERAETSLPVKQSAESSDATSTESSEVIDAECLKSEGTHASTTEIPECANAVTEETPVPPSVCVSEVSKPPAAAISKNAGILSSATILQELSNISDSHNVDMASSPSDQQELSNVPGSENLDITLSQSDQQELSKILDSENVAVASSLNDQQELSNLPDSENVDMESSPNAQQEFSNVSDSENIDIASSPIDQQELSNVPDSENVDMASSPSVKVLQELSNILDSENVHMASSPKDLQELSTVPASDNVHMASSPNDLQELSNVPDSENVVMASSPNDLQELSNVPDSENVVMASSPCAAAELSNVPDSENVDMVSSPSTTVMPELSNENTELASNQSATIMLESLNVPDLENAEPASNQSSMFPQVSEPSGRAAVCETFESAFSQNAPVELSETRCTHLSKTLRAVQSQGSSFCELSEPVNAPAISHESGPVSVKGTFLSNAGISDIVEAEAFPKASIDEPNSAHLQERTGLVLSSPVKVSPLTGMGSEELSGTEKNIFKPSVVSADIVGLEKVSTSIHNPNIFSESGEPVQEMCPAKESQQEVPQMLTASTTSQQVAGYDSSVLQISDVQQNPFQITESFQLSVPLEVPLDVAATAQEVPSETHHNNPIAPSTEQIKNSLGPSVSQAPISSSEMSAHANSTQLGLTLPTSTSSFQDLYQADTLQLDHDKKTLEMASDQTEESIQTSCVQPDLVQLHVVPGQLVSPVPCVPHADDAASGSVSPLEEQQSFTGLSPLRVRKSFPATRRGRGRKKTNPVPPCPDDELENMKTDIPVATSTSSRGCSWRKARPQRQTKTGRPRKKDAHCVDEPSESCDEESDSVNVSAMSTERDNAAGMSESLMSDSGLVSFANAEEMDSEVSAEDIEDISIVDSSHISVSSRTRRSRRTMKKGLS